MPNKNPYLRFIEATTKTRAGAGNEITKPATAPALPAEPEKEIVADAPTTPKIPEPSWTTTTNMENDPHPEVVLEKDDEVEPKDELVEDDE